MYFAALSTAWPTSRLSDPSRVPMSKVQAEKNRTRIASSTAGRKRREKPKTISQRRTWRSFSGSEEGTDDSGGVELPVGGLEGA